MRPVLTAAAFAILATTTPAMASVGLMCSGPDGVAFDAALGGGVGLSTLSATARADGRTWTTDAPFDHPHAITQVQAFSDDETMRLDFADTNVERNVVEVRLFFARAGEGAIGGTLNIPGVGAWVIACDIG